MKILIFIFLSTFVIAIYSAKEKCNSVEVDTAAIEAECSSTEYMSYVECMRKRTKRSADCCEEDDCNNSSSCDDCDCNFCSYGDCSSACSSCCESHPPPCQTISCCARTCQSSCRTSSCRRSCKSKCNKSISSSSTSSKTDVKTETKANITTIINLHNVINNTNLVDIPINVTNVNVNNITLHSPIHNQIQTGETSYIHSPQPPQPPQPPQQSCCKIIGPRQCTPNKCFHYRKSHCGDICTSSIMHAEQHDICEENNPNDCRSKVIYIPQPQPRCSVTSQWPYVQCGIQRAECEGCYSHLVHGGERPDNCSPYCYDDNTNNFNMVGQMPYYPPIINPYGANLGGNILNYGANPSEYAMIETNKTG
jgi:hypothetical protein